MKKIIVTLMAVTLLATTGCKAGDKGNTHVDFEASSMISGTINACYGTSDTEHIFTPKNTVSGFWIGAGPNATLIVIGRYGDIVQTTVI